MVYDIPMPGYRVSGQRILIQSAKATESGPGTSPKDTYDEKSGTYWAAEGDGKYIEYDLGEVKKVIGMDIGWYKGNERTASFHIEASVDENQLFSSTLHVVR